MIEIKDDQDEEIKNESEETTDEAEVVEGEVEDTETEETEDGDEPEEETEADAQDDEEKPQEKKKKSLFGKKDKEPKKDKRDEKIEELTELLKVRLAEFDNFRKRTEKEKASMYDMGTKSVIEKLLPIMDNFERGFQSIKPEDKENDAFVNGMDLVYKQLQKTFEDMGVEVIETEGKEFDPNLHNAVMHIDDENLGENMIAQEFQKGYTYKGMVVRHSMVQVAN